MTSIPKARKRAVLVLDHGEDEMADRLARLRNLTHPDGEDGAPRHDSLPAEPAHDMPDMLPAVASDSPLLARKVAKKSPDFRDMLGPREVIPAADAAAR